MVLFLRVCPIIIILVSLIHRHDTQGGHCCRRTRGRPIRSSRCHPMGHRMGSAQLRQRRNARTHALSWATNAGLPMQGKKEARPKARQKEVYVEETIRKSGRMKGTRNHAAPSNVSAITR